MAEILGNRDVLFYLSGRADPNLWDEFYKDRVDPTLINKCPSWPLT
jgi:hypothetical protein